MKAERSLRELASKIDQQEEQNRWEKKDSKEKKYERYNKSDKSDKKATTHGKGKSSRKPAGLERSDSDGSNASDYAPSSSGSKNVRKEQKRQTRGKPLLNKKRTSRKHGCSSPSSSDGFRQLREQVDGWLAFGPRSSQAAFGPRSSQARAAGSAVESDPASHQCAERGEAGGSGDE